MVESVVRSHNIVSTLYCPLIVCVSVWVCGWVSRGEERLTHIELQWNELMLSNGVGVTLAYAIPKRLYLHFVLHLYSTLIAHFPFSCISLYISFCRCAVYIVILCSHASLTTLSHYLIHSFLPFSPIVVCAIHPFPQLSHITWMCTMEPRCTCTGKYSQPYNTIDTIPDIFNIN